MAEQLFFSRDSKLYIEFDSTLWEIPVLDGFSFSQSTNQSEISLSEMQGSDGLSRRGNRVFTDSLAPAEWSFSTYVRPFVQNSEHHAVEEALWAVMAGADKYSDETVQGSLKLGTGTNAFTNIGGDTAGDRTNGTYTINNRTSGVSGTGPDGTGITGNTGTGTGVAWELDITVSSGSVSAVNVISGGSNFDDGETIILANTAIGGGTGSLTLTIKSGGTEDRNTNFYRDIDADTNSPFGPAVAVPGASNQAINFSQSNRAVLGTCNLYFVMETSATNPMVYKLTSAAFNEASIDFEVDGIATINWSGFAQNITDLQSQGKVSVVTSKTASSQTVGNVVLDNTDGFKLGLATATTLTAAMFAKDGGVGSTSTFIRNRLTQLLVSTTDTTAFPSANYNLTLTGGNITISNNISYLVPEELGAVNIPIEHVTGGRTVNGNFTCYLTLDTDASTTVFKGTSVELFNDMTTSGANKGLEKVVNDFDVTFQIGGAVAATPRLFVKIPKCHIDVPTHSVEDVISVETNFAAYTTDFNVANEVQLEYYGV